MSTRTAPVPRKRPRQERSQATVDAILQATAYILVRDGYARLTTNRVAERAGVNIASIYQFFPNKEAIVTELQKRHVTDMRSRAVDMLQQHRGRSLDGTLRALIAGGLAAHAANPALHRVFEEEMPRLRPRRKAISSDDPLFREHQAILTDAGIDPAELDLVSWLVVTLSHAAIHRGIAERAADVESGALTNELVLILVGYLEKKRRPRRTVVRKRS